jgi:hypothetical protein
MLRGFVPPLMCPGYDSAEIFRHENAENLGTEISEVSYAPSTSGGVGLRIGGDQNL